MEVMKTATSEHLGLISDKHAMIHSGRKRVAGDCSRKRRFCFASNSAKAVFYAAHRARRFARRLLNADPTPRRGA
jgi:hypothetical protein